jgi:predicted DNA-binding transcriptional regulator AlpA
MANLNVMKAAEHTGLSKSTLDKLRCFGGGPAYFKLGRVVRYSAEDLDAWLTVRRRANTWQAANDNMRATTRVAA